MHFEIHIFSIFSCFLYYISTLPIIFYHLFHCFGKSQKSHFFRLFIFLVVFYIVYPISYRNHLFLRIYSITIPIRTCLHRPNRTLLSNSIYNFTPHIKSTHFIISYISFISHFTIFHFPPTKLHTNTHLYTHPLLYKYQDSSPSQFFVSRFSRLSRQRLHFRASYLHF